MSNAIQRLPEVKADSGLSRSSIYAYVAQGLWTHPVRIGPRAVGWPRREVEAINAARIAGRSADQIRTLVAELEAARVQSGQSAQA